MAVASIAAVAGLIAISASDGDGSGSDPAAELGPVHVHGLGVNPADDALYIATHTGMWRLPPDSDKAIPVGESRQDTMGFTIVGPDHFLGSGHPDNLEQPSLLGLIESLDRGATWNAISLLGQADFHVLRAIGTRVYGYDVSGRRLLVSDDRGRTWTERTPQATVLDLAPDPTAPRTLVATTASGLLTSRNAGRTWKRLGAEVGLLGWPLPNRLFLAAANGDVFVSTNPGNRWRRVGSLGGQPSAFLAHSARELYAALHDGSILHSRDAGRSWRAVTGGG